MNLVREGVTPAIGDVEGAPRSLQEREAISSSPICWGHSFPDKIHRGPKG